MATPYNPANEKSGFDVFTLIAGFIAGVVATLLYINYRDKKALTERPEELSLASAIPAPQKRRQGAKQPTKQCPKCKTAYTDQTLNFCLTDGTTLQLSGGDEGEYETIVRNK